MKPVLIDTSVWLTYLRGGKDELSDRVAELIGQGGAAICGTVAAEVVSEAASPVEARRLSEAFRGAYWLRETPETYLTAAELACRLRKEADQELPLSRLMVAVLAGALHVPILTMDSRFHVIARFHSVQVLCA